MISATTTEPLTSDARLRSSQVQVFWLLWGAYASYYLCRVNFAVAQPAGILEVIVERWPKEWSRKF